MTDSNGSLFGKLLLPAYTDAGASTTYQVPPAESNVPSATTHPSSAEEDPNSYGSEAGTEIRDNRTSAAKEKFRKSNLNRRAAGSRNNSPSEEPQRESTTTTNPSDSETVRKPAFFPTTQPVSASASRPKSPPDIPRNKLPMRSSATSVAGTSVVPETGAIDFGRDLPDLAASSEKENQARFQFYEAEGDSSKQEPKSNQPLPTLNAENLQKASLANTVDNESTDSSRSRPNRDSSLLLDEDAGSEVGSDVLSTASEMGTVIEVGGHAKRMADVEAMAAMIDEQFDQITPRPEAPPPAPSRTPTSRKGPDTVASLALPTLDSQNLNQPPTPLRNRPIEEDVVNEKKIPAAVNPTASAMFSSAIRRINTGISKTKASLSAPPTPKTPGIVPPRVEDLLRSTLTPRGSTKEPPIGEHDELPPSLALRSPGSSARVFLSRRTQGQEHSGPILKPRFASSFDKPVHRSKSMDSGVNLDSKPSASAGLLSVRDQAIQLQPIKLSHISPFRFAQKCLSFDSTDDLAESTTSSQVMKLEASLPTRRTEYHKSPMATHMGIKAAASWDVGGASAFRAEPHRSHRIAGLHPTESQHERNEQRQRVHSDFSPTKAGGRGHPNTIELQTPQRVMDVEREDALDILACLVERGVTSWKEDPEGDSSRDEGEGASNSEALVAGLVDELRGSLSSDTTNDKEMQIAALDEMLKSHGYALEMKRAALSAAGWLKSIGRGSASREEDEASEIHMPIIQEPSEVGQASGEDASSDKQSSEESIPGSIDYKMEMLTLRARLHSTQQELHEKSEVAQKLDEELSKCRAEIGRLQIATRTEHNASQSRSILDDGSIATIEPLKETAPVSPNSRQDADKEDRKLFDESFQGNNSLFQDISMLEGDKILIDEPENAEVKALKAALEEANATIRRLHDKVKTEAEEEERDEPPTVSIPDTSTASSPDESQKKEPSSPSDEHRTVNVRMLDGENFVTEWDELRPPLPPPPDHGLHSPIVDAVLEQWTTDHALHDSLMEWIDRVMTGDDLESSVPPLTIQSLDHQVRDGFTMHVLPLLLRRADIHVAVQTRAHRRTTYDMAVTVKQKTLSPSQHPGPNHGAQSLLDYHVNDEWIEKFDPISSADSVAHSAVTEHIGNTAVRSNGALRNHDEEEGYSHFGIPHALSADGEDTQQPTIMGALGGALGGLLSRTKYSGAQSPSRFHDASASIPEVPRVPTDQRGPSLPSGDRMAELDDQPYHRVVSAPPGRIGMTFVELRGHAVVSDVAPDSPLSSWVFPSDILIAVDEVPVSGMRVRDIIKVLTNRKDRQRALRVISSHAMNEFTLNQSALADEPA